MKLLSLSLVLSFSPTSTEKESERLLYHPLTSSLFFFLHLALIIVVLLRNDYNYRLVSTWTAICPTR